MFCFNPLPSPLVFSQKTYPSPQYSPPPPVFPFNTSPAAAANDRHVLVVLQHHLVLLVQIQHRDGGQLGRHAARLRCERRVVGVDQRLHDRVIRRVQMVRYREPAVALAVVRLVPGRRHNPIVPPDIAEVDVQRLPLAEFVFPPAAALGRGAPGPVRAADRVPDRPLLVPPVVGVGEQERLLLHPAVVPLGRIPSQPDVLVDGDGRHYAAPLAAMAWWSTAPARHLHEQAVVFARLP